MHQNFSEFLGDISVIKDELISRIDPIILCEELGVLDLSYEGKEIRGCCPVHNGDNPTAFRVFTEERDGCPTFVWKCFTMDCQHGNGGDMIDLVSKVKNIQIGEAIDFLLKLAGLTPEHFHDQSMDRNTTKERNAFISLSRELGKLNNMKIVYKDKSEFLNENYVETCKKRRNKYFEKRGFSPDVLDLFEVGFAPEHDSAWKFSKNPARATIPIRGKNFKLVGLSGRIIEECESKDKYRIVPGSDKQNTLYGLHFALPYIEMTRTMIIVEGFADLWKCWMAGIKNVVAIMGKDLTDGQLDLVVKLCHKVIVCMDFDEGRNKGGAKTKEILSEFVTTYEDYIDDKKDLGASSIEDIRLFFKKYGL